MRSRCPSARVVATARLDGWSAVYDKPSVDGSSKLNIRPNPAGSVAGVVYGIDDGERRTLDEAEPGYTPLAMDIDGRPTLTYSYEGEPHPGPPYDWYVSTAVLGAASHGVAPQHLQVPSVPDPLAPGIRPATRDDVSLIQKILSEGLAAGSRRYYIHPGDYAWWIYHDDPRHPDHFSTWIQDESGFVTIDSIEPSEISVFTRPGVDRLPLIRWTNRRLSGEGEVGWVSDADDELVLRLGEDGYQPVAVDQTYEWDLARNVPTPELPDGWELRAVNGEEEANSRRAAAHAAFESTMPAAMHLQRYLDFMRSPVYVPERDLIAVTPDGTVVSFMMWWADPASGVAQIEPFGTHPDFHRLGIGRALIYHGLREMKDAGMRLARVCTGADSPATMFYGACSFTAGHPLRWWKKKSTTS